MFKAGKRLIRFAVGISAAVMAMAAGAFGTAALSSSSNIITEYEQPAKSGTVTVAIKGDYIADASKAAARINEIRKEACDQGVYDPRDPSRKLKSSDYVPIKWSYDLEQTARLRAAEASLMLSHDRPNGSSCFTCKVGDLKYGSSEVLAWNYSDTMVTGIDQFYEEKSDWVNRDSSKVTGHYEAMINPSNTFVGIGCFTSDQITYGYPTILCGRFSGGSGNADKPSSALKGCYVPVQVEKDFVSGSKLTFVSGNKTIDKGASAVLELQGSLTSTQQPYFEADCLMYKAKWSSSDESVASVNKYGKITGISAGTAVITALDGSIKKTMKITVRPSVADCKITIPCSSYTYRGRALKPTVTVRNGSVKLTEGDDYSIEYKNNTLPGTASLIIKGIGGYCGTYTKKFTIKPLAIGSDDASISIDYKSYTFTGKAIKPTVHFTFKTGTVIPASDYKVTYSSNTKVGKAKIVVTGITGNVTGSRTLYFVVKPAKQTIKSLTSKSGKFVLSWNKDLAASGYQVLYSKDKNFEKDVHSWTTFDLSNTSEGFSKVPKSGETWYVKVRSFTAQNNTRYGNYSSVRSIKIV